MSEVATVGTRPLLVLWDVDHTLIENGGVSKETYAIAFERLAGHSASYQARTDGRTDPEIMRDMLVRHGVELDAELSMRVPEALERAMSANANRLRERGFALPGARAALEAIEGIPGIFQAPLTGNIQPNAFTKLSAFGLDGYLDFAVGGYGSDDYVRANLVGIARERATEKHGVQFDERTTVLVGDTWRDVRAGRDGGAYVVAVASGKDSIRRLQDEGADVALPDLRDTRAVINAVTGPWRPENAAH